MASLSSLLAKRIRCFFPSSLCPYHHHHHQRHQRHQYLSLFPDLLRLSLSTQSQQSKEEIPFIAQYLVSSFGFSPGQALKLSTSRHLKYIKTPDRPDSVVSFLEEIGLSDSQVRSLILDRPSLLNYNVEKILKPRARAWIDAGFTGEILIQLIRFNPSCLCLKDTLSRIQFWKTFVGHCDDTLLKLIKRNGRLMQTNISKRIMPKIYLLKEYGLSDHQIVKLATNFRGYLLSSLDSIRRGLMRSEELGFVQGSGMFFYGLRAVVGMKKEAVERKVEYNFYAWHLMMP